MRFSVQTSLTCFPTVSLVSQYFALLPFQYFIDTQKDEECMTIYLLDRRVASLPPRRLDVRPIVRHGRVFRRRQRRARGQGVPAGVK